jgi:hypothetical protein
LLLGNLDADLPRAAAAVVQAIDWNDVDKLEAILKALRVLKGALPTLSTF